MNRFLNIRPSFNEFRYYYNSISKNIRPSLIIGQVELFHKKEYDLFFIQLSPKDAIMGSILKTNGSIHQIAIIRENDGSNHSKLEFFLSITFVVEALKPNLGRDKKSKIFERVQFFQTDIFNTYTTATFEDFTYSILSSVKGGFFTFSVSY